MNIVNFYRVAHRLYKWKIPFIPKLIYFLQYLLFNSILPASVVIGQDTTAAYGGIGFVIHKRVIIGDNCIIGQGITIGGKSKQYEVPVIGDNVYLGAGCRVIGPVTIGNNVVIGPNAVVTKSVAEGSIVVGVPAKVIKTGILMKDYV